MIKTRNKKAHIQKKHRSIRKNVFGCADRPRLAVFKSGKHIYVQAIDDEKRVTLASASTLSPELKEEVKSNNIEAAKKVGALIEKSNVSFLTEADLFITEKSLPSLMQFVKLVFICRK